MKYFNVSLIILLFCVSVLAQAPSRIEGIVKDSDGNPLEGAKITVIDEKLEKNRWDTTTDDRGKYKIAVNDGTHTYKFIVEKTGYIKWEESIKPIIFQTLEKDFELKTPEELKELQIEKMIKDNPHLGAYEEARAAMKNNDFKLAEEKFKEALRIKSDYTQANIGLANIYLKSDNCDAAVAEAKKVLKAEEENIPALKIMLYCYQKSGDKKMAVETQARLDLLQPDSPESLFNKAAQLINEGKDTEAIPKLEEAIEIDSEFSRAYFELGFCYMRTGNMEKAKEYLQKYLEIDPEGEKAPDATEALKWL